MSRTDAPPDAEAEGAEQAHGAEPTAEQNAASFDESEAVDAAPVGKHRPKRRWTWWASMAATLGIIALLVAGGFMVKHQQDARAQDRAQAEFVAAARQVVVTLMSIDFKDPQESVQRIVDNSVDPFRQEFQGAAEDFVKVSRDAKVTTKATVNAAAVESMTADTAVALVAASSTVTNAEGVEEAPRNWRLMVDLKRDGEQIKLAKVEFIP